MADLYNKAALERLSSPEQLDKAITVSKPASWLALLGVTVVIVAVVIWSVFGSLPTVTPVQGITVRTEITADNSGDEGDEHDAGDDALIGQIVECYVPYSIAGQISAGMKARVHNPIDDSRYEAKVINVTFDDSIYSDTDLLFSGDSIPVVVSLQMASGNLPDRTLVNASIITEEVAPLAMLFPGIFGR